MKEISYSQAKKGLKTCYQFILQRCGLDPECVTDAYLDDIMDMMREGCEMTDEYHDLYRIVNSYVVPEVERLAEKDL